MADPVRVAVTPPADDRDRLIAPPSQGYVTGEDNLRISSFNALTGVILTVSGRFYDLETRRIVPFSRTHTPNTDRTLKQTIEKLGTGYLLNVLVRVTSGTPQRGQTFVQIELVRGQATSGDLVGMLAGGDVTARQGIAWPGSDVRSSLDGPGALRSIVGTTPAVGVDISETVPTGARWELLSFAYLFTASAVAGSRELLLVIDDGANVLYSSPIQAFVTANQVRPVYRIPGLAVPFIDINNRFTSPLPVGLQLGAGYRVRTSTSGGDVGDVYAAPIYQVREWLEAA